MRTEAEIHNDYFTCQFVLAFPVAGIHRINITTGNTATTTTITPTSTETLTCMHTLISTRVSKSVYSESKISVPKCSRNMGPVWYLVRQLKCSNRREGFRSIIYNLVLRVNKLRISI